MNVLKKITYVLNYFNFFILYLIIYKDLNFLAGALLTPFIFSIVYIYVLNYRKQLNFDMLSGVLTFYFSLFISFLYLFSIVDLTTFIYIQAIVFIILVIDTFF